VVGKRRVREPLEDPQTTAEVQNLRVDRLSCVFVGDSDTRLWGAAEEVAAGRDEAYRRYPDTANASFLGSTANVEGSVAARVGAEAAKGARDFGEGMDDGHYVPDKA
jgi:hypothetical protein